MERTLPLPGMRGRIDHLALDASGDRLFLAALGNGSLEVIDLGAGARIQSVCGLSELQGIVFLPGQGRVVVGCGGDGTVRVLDAATLEESARRDLGDDADNLRWDAAGGLVNPAAVGGDAGALEGSVLIVIPRSAIHAQVDPGGAERARVQVHDEDLGIVIGIGGSGQVPSEAAEHDPSPVVRNRRQEGIAVTGELGVPRFVADEQGLLRVALPQVDLGARDAHARDQVVGLALEDDAAAVGGDFGAPAVAAYRQRAIAVGVAPDRDPRDGGPVGPLLDRLGRREPRAAVEEEDLRANPVRREARAVHVGVHRIAELLEAGDEADEVRRFREEGHVLAGLGRCGTQRAAVRLDAIGHAPRQKHGRAGVVVVLEGIDLAVGVPADDVRGSALEEDAVVVRNPREVRVTRGQLVPAALTDTALVVSRARSRT